MSTCSCTAPRCDAHGEHAPCSVCRDLDARQVATLASLALGASLALDQADEAVLLALQERGLVAKRRRAWVATPEGIATVTRKPRVPLFVERAG